jgi:[ribosomal protein S5]-alanine N-acetyltransferase
VTLELRTPRLLLRPVDEDDLDVLLAIRNAPGVVATTSTGEALPRQTMADQLARRRKSWREHAFGSWLVLLDGEPVAFVEVAPIGEGSGVDPDAIEIGVVVHPDHWGKGFALEAGLAAVRDLFERVALDRIYAGVDPDNDKSLRALAKAPGVRRVDDELYELRAETLRSRG